MRPVNRMGWTDDTDDEIDLSEELRRLREENSRPLYDDRD